MSHISLDGTYRHGRIILSEPPIGVHEARVLVTFLDPVAEEAPVSDRSADAEASRQAAIQRLFGSARSGARLGGGPYGTRDDWYDEALRDRA